MRFESEARNVAASYPLPRFARGSRDESEPVAQSAATRQTHANRICDHQSAIASHNCNP